MPVIGQKVPAFRPSADIQVDWDGFKGGWNNIFKPTELRPDELAQAENLMLVGKGTPTGRWGSNEYFLAGSKRVRMLEPFYVSGGAASMASTNYLLAITDLGYLVKKSGASYSTITGASFASGFPYQGVQLANNVYIAGNTVPFTRFDGSGVIPYSKIGFPTITALTQLSAASGLNTYSWVVTAITAAGQTGSFDNGVALSVSRASLPLNLTQTLMKLTWAAPSTASGTIKGYNIWRGFPGEEYYIDSVQASSTEYLDTGSDSGFQLVPDVNTTGGVKAKYILKFDDRLVLAGIDGDPSLLYVSGRYPNQDRFDALGGGGFIPVSPDDGDEITGLGIAGNQGMSSGGSAPPTSAILVFKKNSVHRVILSTADIGNYIILDPQAQLLTSSNGCSSGDTVTAVENDTFYFGRKGLYTVGQEPNFLNQIRTNELSARIRNYVQGLSADDFKDACAGYLDNKYVLSFPNSKETIIYDMERASFMGPWKTPFGITKWSKYEDEGGNEKWLAGCDDGYTREFSAAFLSDSGTAIAKILRTRKEDFEQWNAMKVLKLFYVLLRNVRGDVTVNLRIEERTGNTVTTKSFNVSSQLGGSGWGTDLWGARTYGTSGGDVNISGDEIPRYANIFKQVRVSQVEVTTTGSNDNFELLSIRKTAQSLGAQSLPASMRV